jgi:hypothetical protein
MKIRERISLERFIEAVICFSNLSYSLYGLILDDKYIFPFLQRFYWFPLFFKIFRLFAFREYSLKFMFDVLLCVFQTIFAESNLCDLSISSKVDFCSFFIHISSITSCINCILLQHYREKCKLNHKTI